MQNMEDGIFVRKVDFDDVDIDDEIDPALKEKLDRWGCVPRLWSVLVDSTNFIYLDLL